MIRLYILAVLGSGPGGYVFAQIATPNDQLQGWLTGSAVSILAAAVIAFLREWVVSGSTYKRVVQERDQAIEALNRQAEENRKLLIPLLSRSVEAQASFIRRQLGDKEDDQL